MTPAFRIFLLMVLAFAAVWVHRFRSDDLRRWLAPPAAPAAEPSSRDPLVSPLGRVLAAYEERGRVRMQGGYAEVPLPAADEPGEDAGAAEAYDGSSDEELADLPLIEEAPGETGGSAEADDGDPAIDGTSLDLADPGLDGLEPRTDGLEPSSPVAPPPPVPPPPVDPGQPVEVVHELRPGESLWKVAERLLGNGNKYREICELNRDVIGGRDPAKLPPGTKLRVRVRRD